LVSIELEFSERTRGVAVAEARRGGEGEPDVVSSLVLTVLVLLLLPSKPPLASSLSSSHLL
jgi:hypothetical protein